MPAAPTTTTAVPATAPPPSAAAAILKTEAKLFGREPGVLFWIIVFPTALLTILGLIPAFRDADPDLGGRRVIDLYVPISVLLAMIVAGVQTMPVALTGYRERGILRRLRTTPARPGALLTAQFVLHGAAMLVSVLLALGVGRLVFDVRLPQQPLGYVLAVALTACAALALGSAISALSRTTKAVQTLGTIVFFPSMFTAGVWVPVQTMPDMLQRVIELTPLGAASQALDQAATGDFPSLVHLGVTALWAALLTGAAVRWFRWE